MLFLWNSSCIEFLGEKQIMVKKFPAAAFSEVEKFTVPKCTKTIIRLTCERTRLFQEIRVVRKDDDYVDAHLREYDGSRFAIRIALHEKMITLLSPDYSWLPNSEDVPAMVARTVEAMLNMRLPANAFMLVRTVMDIES